MGRFHRHDRDHPHPHDHDHQHGDLSGYATAADRVDILERIFDENDQRADFNRAAFADSGVTAVNLMSSPGAGKTAILSATLDALAATTRIGVIVGDVATDLDARRLANRGAQVSLLNTNDGFGGECHLDAPMVNHALQTLELAELDLVLVENVGNLVCPAEFDVGEHAKAMVYAITEGPDKPLKYPVMFAVAQVVLLNKMDLAPHLDADIEEYLRNIAAINPDALVIPVSAKTGDGLDVWTSWLRNLTVRPAPASS